MTPRWPGGTTPRILPPGRPSRPCPRADMVGLVHQFDPAALVRRLPRLGAVAALEAATHAALGEVPAEQLTTGPLPPGHLAPGHVTAGHLTTGHLTTGHLTTGHLTTGRRRAGR